MLFRSMSYLWYSDEGKEEYFIGHFVNLGYVIADADGFRRANTILTTNRGGKISLGCTKI